MSPRGRLILGLSISLAWLLSGFFWRTLNVWLVTGVTGGLALLVSWVCCRHILAPLLVPRTWLVLLGIGAGVFMAGATHLLYPLGGALLPGLPSEVARLYGQLHAPPGPLLALPVLVLVVLAEEVVFRGVVISALQGRGEAAAVGGAALIYALPQLGTGSPLLVALALACGLVWGAERVRTGSLLAPLLTHLLWDLLVFVVFPLSLPTS